MVDAHPPTFMATALAAAARLAGTAGGQAPVDFVRELVGEETWSHLPPDAHRFAHQHGGAIRREVPHFARFAPSTGQLRSIAVPLTVTTGTLSHPRRRSAAAVYEGAGATSVLVPGAGHLAAWERPGEFAGTVHACLDRWGLAA